MSKVLEYLVAGVGIAVTVSLGGGVIVLWKYYKEKRDERTTERYVRKVQEKPLEVLKKERPDRGKEEETPSKKTRPRDALSAYRRLRRSDSGNSASGRDASSNGDLDT